MISLSTIIAIIVISLPFALRSTTHPPTTVWDQEMGVLDLPFVPRVDTTLPPLERPFDATLPHFIAQPTPVLEVIYPPILAGEEMPDGPTLQSAPAARP